jgi:hypothetical protein
VEAFHNAGDAVIFGVRPEVIGPVDVEVREGLPDQALEHVLFSERLDEGSERILMSDPNDVVSVEFDGSSEGVIVEVRVDDVDWPGKFRSSFRPTLLPEGGRRDLLGSALPEIRPFSAPGKRDKRPTREW